MFSRTATDRLRKCPPDFLAHARTLRCDTIMPRSARRRSTIRRLRKNRIRPDRMGNHVGRETVAAIEASVGHTAMSHFTRAIAFSLRCHLDLCDAPIMAANDRDLAEAVTASPKHIRMIAINGVPNVFAVANPSTAHGSLAQQVSTHPESHKRVRQALRI